MKVVFDHNVPYKLRRLLPGHSIQTAHESGWSTLTNGVLLSTAEYSGFQVMVTCDQGIYYQQNLKSRRLSLVVLTSNYAPSVQAAASEILAAVNSSFPGSFQVIQIAPRFVKRPTPNILK